jgi:hypothetical protein
VDPGAVGGGMEGAMRAPMTFHRGSLALVMLASLAGCVGVIGGASEDDAGSGPGGAHGDPTAVPVPGTPFEHLSRREYARAVEHLTGYALSSAELQLYQAGKVGDEQHYVFERDSMAQGPTPGFVEGAHTLALRVAEAVVADPDALEALVACTPAEVADAACLTEVAHAAGRRALRRPLSEPEVEQLVDAALPFALDPAPGEEPDFRWAVEVLLASLLAHPEFLHKVEIGEEERSDGSVRLGSHEIAARLAFTLWGSIPDDALLDAAAAGALDTPDGIEAEAERMLDDARAREQVQAFYAQWLGYANEDIPLTGAMRAEAAAMVERVSFDDALSHRALFTLEETFVDATLAASYALDAPSSTDDAGFGWVSYDADRAGILATGALLVASGVEPSLARRGLRVLDRMLCVAIALPDEAIDTDAVNDPVNGACKAERSKKHREDGACAACHQQFDPIGQGLDGYDTSGRPRELEVDLVPDDGIDCPVDVDGSIALDGEARAFSGPRQLGERLAASSDIDACFVRRMFAFAVGRAPATEDKALVNELGDQLSAADGNFPRLLLRWVGSDAFRHRRPITAP